MLTDLEAPAPPPQHWSWKKMTLWILGILLVFGIAIIAYDEKLEPYDDLMPTRTSTPDSRTNGYMLLKERWENLPKPSVEQKTRWENIRGGMEPWDAAFVDQLRSGRGHLAGDLKAALLLPDFVTPVVLKLTDLSANNQTWILHPFRLLLLEMETQRRAGDWKAALALRTDLHELARRYVHGSHSLMALLVGVSLNLLLIEDTCHLLEREKPDDGKAAELAELWQTDLGIVPAWAETIKGEAALNRDGIGMVKEGRELSGENGATIWVRLLLKRNQTINRQHQQRRQLMREAFRVSPSAPVQPSPDQSASGKWLRYLNANYTGNQLLEENGAFWKILPGLTDNALFRPRALRVRIAIYRWQLQHPGAWPATLQELVPDFLTAVPADPWNGRPLIWDPVSKTISAVGSDWVPGPAIFKKDQRSWFAEDRDNPGLRLEMPPAPPVVLKGSKKPKPAAAPAIPTTAPGPAN
jgi:hypothetical protein